MPEDLKSDIRKIDENDNRVSHNNRLFIERRGNIFNFISLIFQHEMIWISCEGENPADVENIGPMRYMPQRGFPGFYYPFENQKGYLAPIMAIQFERPKSK